MEWIQKLLYGVPGLRSEICRLSTAPDVDPGPNSRVHVTAILASALLASAGWPRRPALVLVRDPLKEERMDQHLVRSLPIYSWLRRLMPGTPTRCGSGSCYQRSRIDGTFGVTRSDFNDEIARRALYSIIRCASVLRLMHKKCTH
jgi:hypothetical protein